MSTRGEIKQSKGRKEVQEAIFDKELEEDLSGVGGWRGFSRDQMDGRTELGGTGREHFTSREPQVQPDGVKQHSGREGLGPVKSGCQM